MFPQVAPLNIQFLRRRWGCIVFSYRVDIIYPIIFSEVFKMCAAAMPKKNRIPPMSDTENLFIEERNGAIASMYDDKGKLGKWMMFFDDEFMDAMWKKAVTLYYKGKLTGIQSIKTSTAAKNPRAGELKGGAIRFTCGPSDDEQLMKSYGRNLVKRFNYCHRNGLILYKTDEQSAIGTRATGNRWNFVYRLHVPK